jgi:hypothetical protein
VNDKSPDRNRSDETLKEGTEQRRHDEPDEHGSGPVNPPMKGTDIPATTDLEYIDREKGKRTTM